MSDGVQVPDWLLRVDQIMREMGVPPQVWYPIMITEHHGFPDPRIATDYAFCMQRRNLAGEDSRGLFQINARAHNVDGCKLEEGARYAATLMLRGMQRTGSVNPLEVAQNSAWPGDISVVGPNNPVMRNWANVYRSVTLPRLNDPSDPAGRYWQILIRGNTEGSGTPPGSEPGNPIERIGGAVAQAAQTLGGVGGAVQQGIERATTNLREDIQKRFEEFWGNAWPNILIAILATAFLLAAIMKSEPGQLVVRTAISNASRVR